MWVSIWDPVVLKVGEGHYPPGSIWKCDKVFWVVTIIGEHLLTFTVQGQGSQTDSQCHAEDSRYFELVSPKCWKRPINRVRLGTLLWWEWPWVAEWKDGIKGMQRAWTLMNGDQAAGCIGASAQPLDQRSSISSPPDSRIARMPG